MFHTKHNNIEESKKRPYISGRTEIPNLTVFRKMRLVVVIYIRALDDFCSIYVIPSLSLNISILSGIFTAFKYKLYSLHVCLQFYCQHHRYYYSYHFFINIYNDFEGTMYMDQVLFAAHFRFLLSRGFVKIDSLFNKSVTRVG